VEGTAVSTNARNTRPGAHLEPLDAIDERLLAALVADARISNKQLAEMVGIAPSTALMRTRALSERGIVQGY
jgi:DNA-binding Lrp family transcriptional regulator